MSGPWRSFPWRTGRKLGRTIYAQRGPLPEDDDPFLGIMDSPQLAADVVFNHNLVLSLRRQYGSAMGLDTEPGSSVLGCMCSRCRERPPTSNSDPATVEGE